jgi:hypothetical protein
MKVIPETILSFFWGVLVNSSLYCIFDHKNIYLITVSINRLRTKHSAGTMNNYLICHCQEQTVVLFSLKLKYYDK